jgi:two-component system, cell cycle sensor histidine kinase DivJ
LIFWPQLEQWAVAQPFAERSSLPFGKAGCESLVRRQKLNALGAGGLGLLWVAANGVSALSDAVIVILLSAPVSFWLIREKDALLALPAVSSLTFIGAGVAASLSSGAWHQTSILWFALASLEGIFSASNSITAASGVLAALAAFIVTLCSKPVAAPSPETAGLAPFVIPALLLALIAATGCSHLRTLRVNTRKVAAEIWENLGQTADGVALRCSLSGQVSAVSATCESMFGLPPVAMMGCGFFERVQVADRPAFLKALADASGGGTASAVLRWRSPEQLDGNAHVGRAFRWLEMRAHPAGESPDVPQERGDGDVTVFLRDITKAKCREAELEEARAGLRKAHAEREHFFAVVSHEIRAPLNAIAGFSELLASSGASLPSPEKQREYARIIHQSGQHLLCVVNAITEMSSLQSGKLALALERFEATAQIDFCCDMVGLAARANGVGLLRAYGRNLGTILCDRRLFTQILANLLSNAVKFTPASGRVTLSARTEADSLLVKVTDTGIGIGPEDLVRLGDPFFQAKGLTGRVETGTGLGLSMVRGFVGLLGGEILIASEKGKGTSVAVRLPVECQTAAAGAKQPVRIATLSRLPLADEFAANRQLMVKKIA